MNGVASAASMVRLEESRGIEEEDELAVTAGVYRMVGI